MEGLAGKNHERFTARLEAFSDLVFGFSLSLLATRLDIPARVEDVFEPTRWAAIIGTFGLVCRFWLEHYRIFRHQFVAQMFDAIVNFIFLFAIAILPYAVQTFLRFASSVACFSLYIGDFSLILLTLSILRLRSLRQRRHEAEIADRLREWRRSLFPIVFALLMGGMLLALHHHGGTLQAGLRDLDFFLLGLLAGVGLFSRLLTRRLPAFLA